jgi:hypothetical protein
MPEIAMRKVLAVLVCVVVTGAYLALIAMMSSAQAQPVAPITPPSQATAPPELIAATVADIPIGAQAQVNPEALIIDENKKVWLNKHVPVGGDGGITVFYLKDGSYEVEIKDDKMKWLKVPVTNDLKKSLIPVKTLHLPPKKK